MELGFTVATNCAEPAAADLARDKQGQMVVATPIAKIMRSMLFPFTLQKSLAAVSSYHGADEIYPFALQCLEINLEIKQKVHKKELYIRLIDRHVL